MAAGVDELVAVDKAGGKEIDNDLYPQDLILVTDVVKGGIHGVETDKGAAAEGAGEKPGDALPGTGNGTLGPADSGEEEQRQGGEDNYEDDVLTVADNAADEHAEEDTGQEVGDHQADELIDIGEGGEMEEAGNNETDVGGHHDIEHEIAEGLAEDNAEDAVVMAGDGHKVLITVVLAGGSCGESDTEQKCLLEDKDEDWGQDEVAIASGGVEDLYFLDGEGLGGDLVFAVGVVAAELYLHGGIHPLGDGGGGGVDGLIGEHEAHVAIDADMGLLHAQEAVLEVGREIEDAVGDLFLDEVLGFFHIVAAIGDLGIGGGVVEADELPGLLAVGHIDDDDGNFTHDFVIVDPRIEEGIDEGDDDEKEQYAFVLENGFHLLCPDVAHVVHAFDDSIKECRHIRALLYVYFSSQRGAAR